MNKVLIVVVVIVVLLGIAWFIFLRHVPTSSFSGLAGSGGTGCGGNNVSVPSGFSSDVTVYPGAKVLTANSFGPALNVTYCTGDSVAQVADYLTSNASGWSFQDSMAVAGAQQLYAQNPDALGGPNNRLLAGTKGTSHLAITVSVAGGQTVISYVYQK